jgi:hypothetical protein
MWLLTPAGCGCSEAHPHAVPLSPGSFRSGEILAWHERLNTVLFPADDALLLQPRALKGISDHTESTAAKRALVLESNGIGSENMPRETLHRFCIRSLID